MADALHAQAQTLLHVSNLFGTEPGWQVAQTLDRLLGVGQPGWPDDGGLRGQVFFANSGAEANECALKLARRFGGRGRHVVVSAFGSFHGRTLATLHATGQPAKHEAFQPLPGGLPPRGLARPRRARGRARPRRWPRCCSSRCRARAG